MDFKALSNHLKDRHNLKILVMVHIKPNSQEVGMIMILIAQEEYPPLMQASTFTEVPVVPMQTTKCLRSIVINTQIMLQGQVKACA